MSTITVTPYFSKGDRYPCLIGVKAEGDEYETAYVSKRQLVEADERHRSEISELRELVRELYEDQCDGADEWRYRDRMRELGIEVEG